MADFVLLLNSDHICSLISSVFHGIMIMQYFAKSFIDRSFDFFEIYSGKAVSLACCVYVVISEKIFLVDFTI